MGNTKITFYKNKTGVGTMKSPFFVKWESEVNYYPVCYLRRPKGVSNEDWEEIINIIASKFR